YVPDVPRPAHEMRHRLCRPIAVEHLEAEPGRCKIALHLGERVRGLADEQADRPLIAIDAHTDEILLARITHLDDEAGHDLRGVDENGGTLGGVGGGGEEEDGARSPDGAKRNPGPAPNVLASLSPHSASLHAGYGDGVNL